MRFYFDIQDDHYSARDSEGVALPSVQAARKQANNIITSIARDLFDADGSQVAVTVRNDKDNLFVLTVTLSLKEFTSPEDTAPTDPLASGK